MVTYTGLQFFHGHRVEFNNNLSDDDNYQYVKSSSHDIQTASAAGQSVNPTGCAAAQLTHLVHSLCNWQPHQQLTCIHSSNWNSRYNIDNNCNFTESQQSIYLHHIQQKQ